MDFWKMIVVSDRWHCSSFVLLLQGGFLAGVGVRFLHDWFTGSFWVKNCQIGFKNGKTRRNSSFLARKLIQKCLIALGIKMALTCPKCGGEISADNISAVRLVARCSQCNTAFSYADKFDPVQQRKLDNSRPARVKVNNLAGALTLRRRNTAGKKG